MYSNPLKSFTFDVEHEVIIEHDDGNQESYGPLPAGREHAASNWVLYAQALQAAEALNATPKIRRAESEAS